MDTGSVPAEPRAEQTEPNAVWRLLDESHADPYMNMAIEEAVMRAVGEGLVPPTLRLWQNHNAVIVGHFQDTAKEVDLEACTRSGTAVVRRISGGGAVYHDRGNLNYALSIPLDDPHVPEEILASYRYYCGGVITALERLGLHAEYAPINDIVVGGRKVSGTAQARRWRAVLHHGTLLLTLDIETMARVLRVNKAHLESKGVSDVRQRVATLEQLGRPCPLEEAKAALVEGFAQVLGVRFSPEGLREPETSLARQLYEEKYRQREWNLEPPAHEGGKGHLAAV